jgi:hypothetical protein
LGLVSAALFGFELGFLGVSFVRIIKFVHVISLIFWNLSFLALIIA